MMGRDIYWCIPPHATSLTCSSLVHPLQCINSAVHRDKYWWIPPHWEHEEHSPPLTQGEVVIVPSSTVMPPPVVASSPAVAGSHPPVKPKGYMSAFFAIKTVKSTCPNHMCKSHCISTVAASPMAFHLHKCHPRIHSFCHPKHCHPQL